jgi:hypothetical protein
MRARLLPRASPHKRRQEPSQPWLDLLEDFRRHLTRLQQLALTRLDDSIHAATSRETKSFHGRC